MAGESSVQSNLKSPAPSLVEKRTAFLLGQCLPLCSAFACSERKSFFMRFIWQYFTYLAKQCQAVCHRLWDLPNSVLFGFQMHRRCPKSSQGVWRDVPDTIIAHFMEMKWKWRSNRRCFHPYYIRLEKRIAETRTAIFAAGRARDTVRRDQLWKAYRSMYRKYHF